MVSVCERSISEFGVKNVLLIYSFACLSVIGIYSTTGSLHC